MSVSSDDYENELYSIEYYKQGEGPPLIKKRSRLIAAVVQNQVDILKELLDSPKWYNVTDKYGYSLLQIAILQNNTEVFDYMLSIPDFPVEFVNVKTETALIIAFTGVISRDRLMNEHFAFELLKKGVCFDKVTSDEGNTLLHCALKRSYVNVAKFLIKAGVDIYTPNNMGKTPLDFMLLCNAFDEIIITLLESGACPTVDHFEKSVLETDSSFLQEILFLYVFDQYLDVEVEFMVLLELATTRSYLFHELVKYPTKVDECIQWYESLLLSIDTDYLKILVEKQPSSIKKIFEWPNHAICYCHRGSLINLDVLLNSDIKCDIINFLCIPNSCEIDEELYYVSSDSYIGEVYCYLLSYGFNLSDFDLHQVYDYFGYDQLFRILLHMDIGMNAWKKEIMPALIYDVSMDLHNYLQNPEMWHNMKELLEYFAHPQLEEIYSQESVTKRENIPEIPLLVELARNSFRKFFIETFEIKTSRKFYTLLRRLPISNVYKKIISYETKLYSR